MESYNHVSFKNKRFENAFKNNIKKNTLEIKSILFNGDEDQIKRLTSDEIKIVLDIEKDKTASLFTNLEKYQYLQHKYQECIEREKLLNPLSVALCDCIKKNLPNSLYIAEQLIRKGANVNFHHLPLRLAIEVNNLDMADMLLSLGAKCNLGTDLEHNIPKVAIQSENPEMIKLLFRYGLYPRFSDRKGTNLLEMTFYKNNVNMVKTLCSLGVDPNGMSGDEVPVIFKAIDRHKSKIVQALLESGADPNIQFQGKKPLEYAKHLEKKLHEQSSHYGLALEYCIYENKEIQSCISLHSKRNRKDVIKQTVKSAALSCFCANTIKNNKTFSREY